MFRNWDKPSPPLEVEIHKNGSSSQVPFLVEMFVLKMRYNKSSIKTTITTTYQIVYVMNPRKAINEQLNVMYFIFLRAGMARNLGVS